MSAWQPDSSSRGQRSTVIGTSGASGPWPGSWPPGKRSLRATIVSDGATAPWAAHASRIAARTSSASSGAPSRRSSPPSARASRRSAAQTAMPASAATCARRMPASSASFFARRRASKASWSGRSSIPSARRRSARTTGSSGGTTAVRRSTRRHRRAASSRSISWRGIPSATRSSAPSSSPSTSSRSGTARARRSRSRLFVSTTRLPADLDVEERVADGERDLVAQGGRALGVGVDQDVVGHAVAGSFRLTVAVAAVGQPAPGVTR